MKVYAIVVTYEGINWIDTCLSSLLKSHIPVHVLVVDNHSKDGTVQKVKKDYPSVEIIENKSNIGFGQANNIGFRKAIDDHADYIFLLNQDAWIEPDAIKVLVAHAEINNDYGLLSPIQLNGDKSALDQVFASHLMQGEFPRFYSDLFIKRNDLKGVYPVAYIPAAAWLLPINTIKTVGGFDPIFQHYGEDDNYLQRIKFFDLKIGICPESIVYHDKKFETEEEIKQRENSLEVFEKDLKVNYAHVNVKRNLTKYGVNMAFQSCRQLLKLDFKAFRNNMQRLAVICGSYSKIKRSLKTNKIPGLHYIPSS